MMELQKKYSLADENNRKLSAYRGVFMVFVLIK